jgi:hypothetical protein
MARTRTRLSGRLWRRTGEPVVWIRPRRSLFRVQPSSSNPVGQLSELMTAALANRSERH